MDLLFLLPVIVVLFAVMYNEAEEEGRWF